MTRKDYKLIAQHIWNASSICTDAGDEDTRNFIADYIVKPIVVDLKADNERFDPIRFVNACGYADEILN